MSADVVYEIARFDVQTDPEVLVERIRLESSLPAPPASPDGSGPWP
jgi:hypothetical protein